MSFQYTDRLQSTEQLPPIKTFKSPVSHTAPTPVLPPLTYISPPIPPLISPITPPPDFTKSHNQHISQPSYVLPQQKSDHMSPTNGHFHFHPNSSPTQQSYIDAQRSQSFSPPGSASQLPHIPPTPQPPSHHPSMVVRPMHPYAHPIYHQARPVIDPATELLAEKRRRNAGASARFRDRRKQREREMQEKCQFLERRVQELESTDSAKRIAELEKKLEEAIEKKEALNHKLQEQDKELQRLRSRLNERNEREREFEFLTPPSTGDYDSKEILFDNSRLSRSPSTSSTSSEHRRKPTDVQSLLS